MRIITKTVYLFDELPEESKERALENLGDLEYFGGDELKDTLDAFERLFPVKIRDWEYSYGRRGYINWTLTCDDVIADLSGIRLLKYLYNNYFGDLFLGRYYNKVINGRFMSKRSKAIFDDTCCVLTGVCYDNDILKPIYDFFKNPCPNVSQCDVNLSDLMNDCLESWLSAANRDIEDYYSEEHLKELAIINEWEFYESGKMVGHCV